VTGSSHPTTAIGRRSLLTLSAGATAGVVGASVLPGLANAVTDRGHGWPTAQLPASAALDVDPSQFLSTRQLSAYGKEANALGLRATGSAKHEAYVAKLAQRLRKAGVQGVRREPVPMMQWLADSWSVEVNNQAFPHTFYMPYTRATGAAGLSGDTVYVPISEEIAKGKDLASALQSALAQAPVAGKIAVFDVSYTTLPLSGFQLLSYPGAFQIGDRDPSGDYVRPWFNSITPIIDCLIAAGATGLLGIWPDLPGEWAQQYTPYDGIFRSVPGLWVDSTGGAQIKALAGNGAPARLVLNATVRNTVTHNVIGFIPGRSKELTVLHTHTDGTNGMEENGQIGILATAQYLARLPRKSLDRTVMVFLSTGHFAGGVGIRHFLARHKHRLVPRITSILTLEHLGTKEFLPGADGIPRYTGEHELGAFFSANAPGLVDACVRHENRVNEPCTVARPFVPSPVDAIKPQGWPGEGTYFWWYAGIQTSNYITGPYGLITADLDTTGMVDYKLMRKIAMTTVRTTVQLAGTSKRELKAT